MSAPARTRTSRILAVALAALGLACSGESGESPSPSPSQSREVAPEPEETPEPEPPAAADAPASADGAQVYQTYCVTCHGPEGRGDGPGATALDPKPRNFATADYAYDANEDGEPGSLDDIAAVIRNGAARYGGSPLMVPWGPVLSDPQIEAVAEYVQGLEQGS